MDLALCDPFTAEQNPAVTAKIINVKGQRLITSWWSQPTFDEQPLLLDSTDAQGEQSE